MAGQRLDAAEGAGEGGLGLGGKPGVDDDIVSLPGLIEVGQRVLGFGAAAVGEQEQRVRAVGHVGRRGVVLGEAGDVGGRAARRQQGEGGITQGAAAGALRVGREGAVSPISA